MYKCNDLYKHALHFCHSHTHKQPPQIKRTRITRRRLSEENRNITVKIACVHTTMCRGMFQSPAAKSTTLKIMLSKAKIQALENEAQR